MNSIQLNQLQEMLLQYLEDESLNEEERNNVVNLLSQIRVQNLSRMQ